MSDKNVIQVKFIDKPKGLRFNSHTSRHIREMGIEYMEVELGRFALTFKPALKDDENPKVNKVLFSGEVAQIASAELFDEFSKRDLVNEKVQGEWKGNKYVFDLVPIMLGAEYKNFNAGAEKGIPGVISRHKIRVTPVVQPVLVHTSETKENAESGLEEGKDYFIDEMPVVYDDSDPVI